MTIQFNADNSEVTFGDLGYNDTISGGDSNADTGIHIGGFVIEE